MNITMQTGDAALEMPRRFQNASRERFATIAWMDWAGVEREDFVRLACDRLERMVELGAFRTMFLRRSIASTR